MKDYQKQILEDLKQKEKLVLVLPVGAGKAKIKDNICFDLDADYVEISKSGSILCFLKDDFLKLLELIFNGVKC